jgi:hypothetical protein
MQYSQRIPNTHFCTLNCLHLVENQNRQLNATCNTHYTLYPCIQCQTYCAMKLNILTARSTIVSEKPVIAYRVLKFSAFYGNRRCTRAHNRSSFLTRRSQSVPSPLFLFPILTNLPSTTAYSKVSFSAGSYEIYFVNMFYGSSSMRTKRSPHLIVSDLNTVISDAGNIVQLLIQSFFSNLLLPPSWSPLKPSFTRTQKNGLNFYPIIVIFTFYKGIKSNE